MSSEMKKAKRPFGKRDQFGYMFGNLGNDFTFQLASGYLLVYYTKVLGISAGFVGTLFLVARLLDAFTDVGMGNLCDRSKTTKNGKFRPWVRRFSIPVALASCLMYNYFIADMSMGFKLVYVTVTYLLWGSICYTGVNIPYGSMASVISGDAAERASLSTFRSIGSMIAGMAIGMITPQLVYVKDAAGNAVASGSRFLIVAIVFSTIAIICYELCLRNCEERIELPPVEKSADNNLLADLKFLVRDRAFLSVIGVALFTLLAAQIGMALNQYLFLDYFGNTSLMSVVMIAQTAGMFLLAPFAGKLTSKFGKKEAGGVCLGIVASIYVITFLLKVKNPMVYIGLQFLLNIANGYYTLVCYAYLTDVIDHYQVKSGKRKDGTIYAVYSFARKLAQALAGAVGGWTLALIGYNSAATVQTDEVKSAIFAVTVGVPAVCYIISCVLQLCVYPLSKAKVEENQQIIAKGE